MPNLKPTRWKGYAMGKISEMGPAGPQGNSQDVLTEIIRSGAQRLLAEALEIEVEEFVARFKGLKDDEGRQRIVRNGYLPERQVQTGVGAVTVQVPRARDRASGEAAIRFSSAVLPPYLRRSRSIEGLLPWLYLKGISTGDFGDALSSLLGPQAPGLSASTITRLKKIWEDEYAQWNRRDLSGKRYVYVWADGVYFQARLEEQKQCILVLMGSTSSGQKELIAIQDGYRESEQSWSELLLDLKHRGLEISPLVAVGDGALGFWKALSKISPKTTQQRCWVHKTANVLNKLPKSLQPKAKSMLQNIWMAESRAEAEKSMSVFAEIYRAKYPKAVECVLKDKEELLAFYDFPAEHWKHLRTTNPIESTFATVRLRTVKTRGCLSRTTALTMVFQLCRCAQKSWRKLDGYEQLGKLIDGVRFIDGVEEIAA
jgi:transposase-like protein